MFVVYPLGLTEIDGGEVTGDGTRTQLSSVSRTDAALFTSARPSTSTGEWNSFNEAALVLGYV